MKGRMMLAAAAIALALAALAPAADARPVARLAPAQTTQVSLTLGQAEVRLEVRPTGLVVAFAGKPKALKALKA